MKNSLASTIILIGFILSTGSLAAATAIVKNGNNSGAGSFRAALESGATTVRFSPKVSAVKIIDTLIYKENKNIRIQGSGQVIDGSGLVGQADIFAVVNGANVIIEGLDFVGNYFQVNETPSEPEGGKGIFINVPSSRQGVVKIDLSGITVTGVGNHGIHISDCTLWDECGGGSGGAGQGSVASVSVNLDNVHINRVGFGKQDADGIRVDERGEGDIYFTALNSTFINVGADGIELDEGNEGDIVADVRHSVFDGNGEYCNLIPFVAGGQCDDDGYADVDDGFDLDEAGDGSIHVGIRNTVVSNNYDEGLDIDEEGPGGISVRAVDVLALANGDEGIKASESDAGDLRVVLKETVSIDNNGSKEGVELEESDLGDVTVRVIGSTFVGGHDEKLKIEQEGAGEGTVKVYRSGKLELDLDGASRL